MTKVEKKDTAASEFIFNEEGINIRATSHKVQEILLLNRKNPKDLPPN